MVVFEAAGFRHDALEDATHGDWIQGGFGVRREAIEEAPLTLGIGDVEPFATLRVAHSKHVTHALGEEAKDLEVDLVDPKP